MSKTMKTTLDIATDVLAAAKQMSAHEKKSVGQLISELARKGLALGSASTPGKPEPFHGFRPFPSRGGRVTNDLINGLRQREGV